MAHDERVAKNGSGLPKPRREVRTTVHEDSAMTTSAHAAPAAPKVRYKRSIKNYLIDSHFQLKYTGMILVVAIAISAVLGIFLWQTSGEVVQESQKVVEQSKKVSDVVKILSQQAGLVRQQHMMLYALVGALAVMVFLIGVLGIYFTHKVAGPIYKMKLLLRQVSDGKLNMGARLRKGDELQDFFDVFAKMVESLRERQRLEVEQLNRAIELAKSAGVSEASIEKFGALRDEMQRALEA
jgi:nitrogen fixation/metabolism regulation signal transduction histidine kinase